MLKPLLDSLIWIVDADLRFQHIGKVSLAHHLQHNTKFSSSSPEPLLSHRNETYRVVGASDFCDTLASWLVGSGVRPGETKPVLILKQGHITIGTLLGRQVSCRRRCRCSDLRDLPRGETKDVSSGGGSSRHREHPESEICVSSRTNTKKYFQLRTRGFDDELFSLIDLFHRRYFARCSSAYIGSPRLARFGCQWPAVV